MLVLVVPLALVVSLAGLNLNFERKFPDSVGSSLIPLMYLARVGVRRVGVTVAVEEAPTFSVSAENANKIII